MSTNEVDIAKMNEALRAAVIRRQLVYDFFRWLEEMTDYGEWHPSVKREVEDKLESLIGERYESQAILQDRREG